MLAMLSMLPALAAAQSLGEAAKKERERREKLRQAGVSTRTLTEDDVASTKGQLANDPNEPAAVEEVPPPRDLESGESGPVSAVREPASGGRGEAYWRRRVGAARGRLAQAQERHDFMQAVLRRGQPAAYDENGKRVMYSIHQLKVKADAAAAALAAAQKALDDTLEDARRSGALPGWLR
jgi:hypothetical protein